MSLNILAIDIGGTNIKSGIITANGAIRELPQIPVDSSGNAEISTFIDSVKAVIKVVPVNFESVGICIPGPFDYESGESLMTHKFKYLNGINLKNILKTNIPKLRDIPMLFCHDANAFLEGEIWQGSALGSKRSIGITLGTGVGVACCIDGQLLCNELGAPAVDVSIWDKPYRDAKVEDYVSGLALVSKFQQVHPDFDSSGGVKSIAKAAKNGDSDAIEIFNNLGTDLGSILGLLCKRLKPEVIVFGGQISKDFELFETSLRQVFDDTAAKLQISTLGTAAALYGVANLQIQRNPEYLYELGTINKEF